MRILFTTTGWEDTEKVSWKSHILNWGHIGKEVRLRRIVYGEEKR